MKPAIGWERPKRGDTWPGYEIITVLPEPAIQCLCCGRVSYSLEDIRNLYCGFCNEFHEDRLAACRVKFVIERLIRERFS
jgi:hypothetical protein